MSYDDTFRLEILDMRDEIIADLQAEGLIFAEQEVRYVTVASTASDEDQDFGRIEETTSTYYILRPRPKVDMRDQFRSRGGITTQVGNAKVTISRAAIDEETLLGAAYFLIGGSFLLAEEGFGIITEEQGRLILEESAGAPERYTVVKGEIIQTPLDWIVILQKERG